MKVDNNDMLLKSTVTIGSISMTVFFLMTIQHYYPAYSFACNMMAVIVVLFLGEQFLTGLVVFPWIVSMKLVSLAKEAKSFLIVFLKIIR